MQVVACYSIKGGVGKTTTAVNLAWSAASEGYRTLLWDLDPQGAASYCLRVRADLSGGARRLLGSEGALEPFLRGSDYPNLDLLPADFSLRRLDSLLDRGKHPKRQLRSLIRSLAHRYDLVVMDCAPSISLASENVFRAADVLLVPVIPAPLSLRTLEQLRAHLKRKGPDRLKLRAFFSMADARKALHKRTVAEYLGQQPELLRTVIPYASPIELMSLRQSPLGAFASRHPATAAYLRLWHEVVLCL